LLGDAVNEIAQLVLVAHADGQLDRLAPAVAVELKDRCAERSNTGVACSKLKVYCIVKGKPAAIVQPPLAVTIGARFAVVTGGDVVDLAGDA
jgi:hypothetical protein